MRPEAHTRPEYVAAFTTLAQRIAESLKHVPAAARPIAMYVAGGAAIHFYTGVRVSVDVDASFSRRIALPDDLDVEYRDEDGAARLLYFDRQYNDTFALLHEDANDDSIALELDGVDARVLDVRLLAPVDLAVSKLSRWSPQDRDDVLALGRRRLITAKSLEARALDAIGGYVGDTVRLTGTIAEATRRLSRLA